MERLVHGSGKRQHLHGVHGRYRAQIVSGRKRFLAVRFSRGHQSGKTLLDGQALGQLAKHQSGRQREKSGNRLDENPHFLKHRCINTDFIPDKGLGTPANLVFGPDRTLYYIDVVNGTVMSYKSENGLKKVFEGNASLQDMKIFDTNRVSFQYFFVIFFSLLV